MITADQVNVLTNIFETRDAKVFHACQLRDFRSYVTLGGIPSRNLLEQNHLPFTQFDTDQRDHDNNVWDKVFVNLHDFGKTFASGGAAVPNTFGPILFVLRPNTFSCANDVAICMRSAGAFRFNREREGIAINEINNLFVHPMEAELPQRSYVKFARELGAIYPDAHEPEVSCTVEGELIPLDYVAYILVDPYVIHGNRLSDCVRDFLRANNIRITVIDRTTRNLARGDMYNEFLQLIDNNAFASIDTLLANNLSDEMGRWTESIRRRNLWWQVPRFTNYLRAGTISPLITP